MHRLIALSIVLCLWPVAAPCKDFAKRQDVREFITEMHQVHGFERPQLINLFRAAHPLPVVLRAIRPPADPRIRSWRNYRGRFVESRRIANGRAFLAQHRDDLLRAEAQYGVPAEIIVAIIGVETIYGRHVGNFQSFSTLSTLAFHYPPRATLFRRELESLLLLARDEARDPLSYRGSYAGALGLPQFLPSSIRSWAVDFDGDGRIDLTGSADAIGSVARFLAAHGWVKDGPVLLPASVRLADKLPELLADGILPRRTPQEMQAYGVEAPASPAEPAALIELVTPDQPTEYRLGFRNFYVLTRYNQSSFYATTVYELAMALKEAMKVE